MSNEVKEPFCVKSYDIYATEWKSVPTNKMQFAIHEWPYAFG
jgi:hypothetical protein